MLNDHDSFSDLLKVILWYHTYKNQEVGGEEQVLDHVGEEPVHVETVDRARVFKEVRVSVSPSGSHFNTDRDRPFRIHCPDITRSFSASVYIHFRRDASACVRYTLSLSPFPYQSRVCHYLPRRFCDTNQAAYLESSRNLQDKFSCQSQKV